MPFVSPFLNHNNKSHILKYVIFPSVYLSVIALLSTNPSLWTTSSIHHFYIELFGAVFAGILAFYYISRARTFNDKFSLFIGIGFLVNALIDLFHVTVSMLNIDNILFLKYFIPQTWFAGRLYLSAMFAIAIFKYNSFLSIPLNTQKKGQILSNKNNKNSRLSNLLRLYLIIVTLLSSIVALSSLFVVFSFSEIDNFPIHRPYELVPLALFLFSLYYFYKNQIYRNKDILYVSIVISIVFDIFGQIIMSYAAYHFDTAFNIAHVLKVISYFINIIGLTLSSIHYNIKLRETNNMLSQQYEKVKESEKMKSEFINIAAHELRTPIQPILGLTDIIYSKIEDKEQHELLEIIMRNAKRLKRLTDNVLDVTKIESQSLMLKKEKINLNILIYEVLKEYVNKELKQQQMIKIVYDFKYTNDDIIVEADRVKLAQVIRNLIDNALKFTTIDSNQQTIFVIVDKKKEEEKEQAIISVKDSGTGISKEVLPKLFSKFTTSDSGKGTGLGLYICKSIIEAHGGEICGENNLDGKGATFRFKLPIAN
ncbi:MAG TPA: ATP-binding protein [Nitrososphaeraceae archaeon]|nr:ATP-binding protein [Nitrososphaeraceae archaeon]